MNNAAQPTLGARATIHPILVVRARERRGLHARNTLYYYQKRPTDLIRLPKFAGGGGRGKKEPRRGVARWDRAVIAARERERGPGVGQKTRREVVRGREAG